MLSSEEMVMDSSGKMLKLLEFVKANGGEPSNVAVVNELPLASLDTSDKLYLLNTYTPPAVNPENIIDVGTDKDNFIKDTDVIIPNIDWSKWASVSITCGNYKNGDIWTQGIVTTEPIIGKEISINPGTLQAKYIFTDTGLQKTSDVYTQCGIVKITGIKAAVYPALYVTYKDGDNYYWHKL